MIENFVEPIYSNIFKRQNFQYEINIYNIFLQKGNCVKAFRDSSWSYVYFIKNNDRLLPVSGFLTA